MTTRTLAIWTLGILLAGCEGPSGEGLRPTPTGDGPRIVFDLAAKPLPEIPLPNNVATRYDPESPTTRRINVSLEASTKAETLLRRKINELDGFGVFQPITVSFDAPLDLANIQARHNVIHDFADDVILLVNVDPISPGYGELVPLDLGRGNYPLGLEWASQYWDMDEHADSPNLLFETHDEDENGNGVLDPYEDIDFDGVLDKPNTWSGKPLTPVRTEDVAGLLAQDKRPIDDLITFYERETDTLIAWPVAPLREATTYAVVLTTNLKGENGAVVRSPFKYVNHISQNEELAPLAEVLAAGPAHMGRSDIVFAWSFTTQTVTAEMEAVRAGLYGIGPLDFLADEYPPDMEPKQVNPDEEGALPPDAYVLYAEDLELLFGMAELLLGYAPEVVEALQYDARHIDYFVLGSYTTPYFLADQDGVATKMYPGDDDESFAIDLAAGEAVHGPNTATFICAIPKTTAEHQPPFPMVHYGHGYSGAPFEILGFAGRFAQYGYALCGIDALGHGLALPSDEDINYDEVVPTLLEPLGLSTFYNAFKVGRIRDLDNDGKRTAFDNGGDFWSYDIFHTRDCVRQAAIDIMQFVRILRSLGERKWTTDTNQNGLEDDLMGDFNGDGIVDMGGPDNTDYPQWGQSMGAIVAEVLAGTEGTTTTATPISGAGGLIQVGIRTTNPGVPEAVWMPLFGPFVVFTPVSDLYPKGEAFDREWEKEQADRTEHTVEMEVAIMINDQHREDRPFQDPRPHYYPFLRTDKIAPGDRVIVRNKSNGEEVVAFRHPDGAGFRVSLPADALSAIEKRPLLGLQDGDTQPVPVSCAPGTWSVLRDEEGAPVGPAVCDEEDIERSLLFGDALEIVVLDGWDGDEKARFDTFDMPVQYHGAIFPEGAPLVAIGTGLGRARNTPELRKLMGFSSMILSRGDPLSYARHYGPEERLDFSYDPGAADHASVLIYHTVGDPNTPIATSLALARAAGIVEYQPAIPGAQTQNDHLLDSYVAEGVEGFWRFLSATLTVTDWENDAGVLVKDMRWPDEFSELLALDPTHPMPVHADPDDLDAGTNEYGEPTVGEPVRATLRYADGKAEPVTPEATGLMEHTGGFSALRMPYIAPLGAHGVEPSNPSRQFDVNSFVENQIGLFMQSQGRQLSDDPCLATSTCPFLPATVQEIGEELYGKEE